MNFPDVHAFYRHRYGTMVEEVCAAFALVNLHQHRNRLASLEAEYSWRLENEPPGIKQTRSNAYFPTIVDSVRKNSLVDVAWLRNQEPAQRLPKEPLNKSAF